MTSNKRIALGIAVLTAFLFLVFATLFSFDTSPDSVFGFLAHYHVALMMLVPTTGIVVGALAYYLMSDKVDKVRHDAKKTAEIVLKFLSTDERKVAQYLISHDGRALQSQLSHLDGLTRLKAHRIVSSLEREGIVKVERVGKVNEVTLVPEVRDALVSRQV